MNIPKISIRNLYKSFNKKIIFKDINLEIYSGEIVTILGGSGSGKSVFLKTLIGLIEPDKGHIFCDNIEITASNRLKFFFPKIGVLFQNNALFDSMNIYDNLIFPLMNKQNIASDELVDQVLKSVGLSPSIKNQYLFEISGGMQKRVALARCIITKPEIIFLDEPTSGLDFENTKLIFNLIKKLSDEYKITFLMVTHDIHVAPSISDKILLLENKSFSKITKEELIKRFLPIMP